MIEGALVQMLHVATNVVYKSYIINYGHIEVPEWSLKQME